MKKLLLFLTLSTIFVNAQTFQPDSGNYNKYGKQIYKIDTVMVSNQTKESIFSNSLAWLSNNFKDSRNVIETKDINLGEITFKCFYQEDFLTGVKKNGKDTYLPIKIFYTGKFFIKDKKYRIILTDLRYSYLTDSENNIDLSDDITYKYNKKQIDASLSFYKIVLKDIVNYLNRKSDNDF